MEVEVSRMMAAAASKLLQKDQAEAAQQQAQQAAQDPLVQMQQEELRLKEREVALKEKKAAVESVAKIQQVKNDQARIAAQKEIAGMQIGAKAAHDKASLTAREKIDGARIGFDIAKTKKQDRIQMMQLQSQMNKPTKGE